MNILVVDDENTLRRTIRTTLETQGHAVAEAATGAQATDRVRTARPDLVLLDLKLGRENGLDVLAELHRVAPGVAACLRFGLEHQKFRSRRAGVLLWRSPDPLYGNVG